MSVTVRYAVNDPNATPHEFVLSNEAFDLTDDENSGLMVMANAAFLQVKMTIFAIHMI